MIYLLDANAFMEATRSYYAFDLAPCFWDWLGSSELHGQVGSIDRVKEEIAAGSGDLVDWVGELDGAFWLPETAASIESTRVVAQWATDPSRNYTTAAVSKFMDSADLHLIAHARVADGIVVTREKPEPESKKNIKIPDVGNAFGVKCIQPFEAYRALGLRLC